MNCEGLFASGHVKTILCSASVEFILDRKELHKLAARGNHARYPELQRLYQSRIVIGQVGRELKNHTLLLRIAQMNNR